MDKILVDNAIIDKFMGKEPLFDIWDINGYHGDVLLTEGLEEDSVENEISHYESQYDVIPVARPHVNEYHKSWDLLIPVVKKCWGLTSEFEYDDEYYIQITEEIFHPDYTLNALLNDNIKDIYNRVVEFITWYNSNSIE